MWLRNVTVLLLLICGCSEPRRWHTIFVDENCIKRRFDFVDGEGVKVSTIGADGTLTVTAHFTTGEEAMKAYPIHHKGAAPCPADVRVSVADAYPPDAGRSGPLASHQQERPAPATAADAGSAGSQ